MNTVADLFRPVPFPSRERLRDDAVTQVFTLMRIGFFLLPLLMGIDKFAKVLQNDWPMYLAGAYNDIIPGSAQTAMYIVGAVEIVAALVVLVIPRFGGLLVAGWLGGIVASLVIVGGYGDIVLRDLALLLIALSLSRLAWIQPTVEGDHDHTKAISGSGGSVSGQASNGAGYEPAAHRVTS
ncbi:MAG: hypothetical protein KJ006_09215 [Thermoleophilia bacterium]|nr:hypothetical protein [Thermoleophilia bacterium]